MKVGDIVNVKGRLWKTKTVYRRSIHHASSRPEKALYLGVSYLNEGEVVWGGENEPNYLHVTNRIKVAVLQRIGGNKYYRPFYALPSDIEDVNFPGETDNGP